MVAGDNTFDDIEITALGNDGEGIGTLPDGKKVFVPDVLPGEICDIQIVDEAKRYSRGTLVNLKTTSEDRCLPVNTKIPGANLAHLNYQSQLQYKTDKVKNCLKHLTGLTDEEVSRIIVDTVPSEDIWNYRNHMQYKISNGKLCLMSFHTNEYVRNDIDKLGYSVFGTIRNVLEEIFTNAPTLMFSDIIMRGSTRTSEVVLEFVTNSDDSHEIVIRDAKYYLDSCNVLEKISSSIGDYKLNGITLRISTLAHEKRTRTGKRVVLYGEDFYTEKLCGRTFQIKAGAFFQVNIAQAEKLYTLAAQNIKDAKTLCDFYCGTGSIGLCFVNKDQNLIGVESVSEAIESAKINAKLSSIDNATFICRPAERFDFKKEHLPFPDAIIVDPPRKGMHPGFIKYIGNLMPQKISYVSCDPATLARDLKPILQMGYKILSATPVDLFPNTSHVETVVQLSKGSVPSQDVKVKFSMENVSSAQYLDKPATYDQIKAYVKEYSGLNVSSLYIAQVKQKYGIIERECYNLPKSVDSRQPKCPESKEKAIVEALKYFKMI